MAQLTFYDADHQYQVDGEIYPSVSEILRFISREIYNDVNQYNLDHAADRGTRVHKALEVLNKFGQVECDDDIVPYVQAYLKFTREHAVKWDGIEKAMFHPEAKYAGTLDRFGTVDGKYAVLDFKTSYAIHKPLVKAQLNGYRSMLEINRGCKVEALYCLHLKKDGTYRLVEFPLDSTEFDACMTLHRALEKKRRNHVKVSPPVSSGAEDNQSE